MKIMKYLLFYTLTLIFTSCLLSQKRTINQNNYGELMFVEHYFLDSDYYFRYSLDNTKVIELIKSGSYSKCDTVTGKRLERLNKIVFGNTKVNSYQTMKHMKFVDIRRVLVFNFQNKKFTIGLSNVRPRMQIGNHMYKADKDMISSISSVLQKN
jgi:hypothetical protein